MNRKTEFGRNSAVINCPTYDNKVWQGRQEANPQGRSIQGEEQGEAPPRKRKRQEVLSNPVEDFEDDRRSYVENLQLTGRAGRSKNDSVRKKAQRMATMNESHGNRLRDWLKKS